MVSAMSLEKQPVYSCLHEFKVGRCGFGTKLKKHESESNQGVNDMLKPIVQLNNVLCSVIIVTHNNLFYTKQCLESLKKTSYPAIEIVIVDAASSDGTVEYLRTLPVKLVCLDQNYAYSYSLNRGIEASKGIYLCFLNNDTLIVQPDWLKILVDCLNTNSSIGVVAPKLVNNASEFGVEDKGFFLKTKLVMRDGLQFPRLIYPDGNQYHVISKGKTLVPCTFIVGACMLIKRSLISTVGFFDERFFFAYDETDFCMRSWLAGKKVVCNTNSVIVHLGSKTMSTVPKKDFSSLRYDKSQALFYSKYGSKDFGFVLKKVKGFSFNFWVVGYKITKVFLIIKQALDIIRDKGITVFLKKLKVYVKIGRKELLRQNEIK
jgi:GT2 family glycosyltransferase